MSAMEQIAYLKLYYLPKVLNRGVRKIIYISSYLIDNTLYDCCRWMYSYSI